MAEVDLKQKVWTVPADRMKARKPHRVPLSKAALDLLETLPTEAGNDFIFIGAQKGKGLSNMSMSAVLRRMHCDVTVHGFRSTFRDWAAESTGYANHVVEQALAHTISDAVERAYRRGDMFEKRAKLMSEWATYCCSPRPAAGTNITPLRRAK